MDLNSKDKNEESKNIKKVPTANNKTGSSHSISGIISDTGSNRNSGQFEVIPVICNKTGDVQVPRRLSQLFTPPSLEELGKEDETTESTCLLGDASEPAKKATIVPKLKEAVVESELEDRLSILDDIENGNNSSELGSSGRNSNRHAVTLSSSSPSEDNNDDFGAKGDCYTSWDDTICSNRSAYFKHYYQKYSSSLVPSRQSTRASSLISLIKEKGKMNSAKQEEEDKKKRRENIGLMALVIFLFLVLVIGISLIYHFYNIHLEELSLFKKLKFHEDRRLLNLYDSNNKMDIQARLGTTLSPYSKAEDCTHYLHYLQTFQINKESEERLNQTAADFIFRKSYKPTNEFQFDEETVCLEWANQARIQIHRAPTSKEFVNCYNVFWSAQNHGLALQDCVKIKEDSSYSGVWWGIGDVTGGGYPLDKFTIPSSPLKTGQLGRDYWGRIMRRTFLSSNGGLLMLPNHLPASVSISSEELCIAVNASTQIDKTGPLTLNYTVCASPNVSSSLKYLHHLAGAMHNVNVSSDVDSINNIDTLLDESENTEFRDQILERIENPVWVPNEAKLDEKVVLDYADKILAYNQSLWGHILLPSSWQSKIGVFKFNSSLFPEAQNLSSKLRLKGFRLALTISPIISTDTNEFRNGTREGLFVQQKDSSLPALISFDSVLAGALTDFTNPRATEWFLSRVQSLKDDLGVDRFHVHPPDSRSIPTYHEFNQHIPNPDLALQPFIKAVSKVEAPLSTDGSLGPPPLPTFVTVGNQESGWASLASLVPRIMTLTMLGFPLIDAGIVGGNPGRLGNVPDDELFIRWTQAATFLPAFQMSTLPSEYEETTKDIVSDYLSKRQEFVLPRLRRAVGNTLLNHSALISPLALLYPDDSEAAKIGDEWLIGDDLLVAPVLQQGETTRNIYIPDGLWESQLDKRLKRGPGWIYDYKVPLTDLAFFIKRYYSALSS